MAEAKFSIIMQLLDKVSQPLDGIKAGLDKFGDVVKDVGKGLVAAFAVEKVGEFFAQSVEHAALAEESMRRLELAVGNAGGSWEEFKGQADAAVQGLMAVSTATDEEANEALTRLITVTGDTGLALKNLGVVADVAAFSHKSMSDAAELVGKVLQGNVKPLREFGIAATDSTDAMDQLRSMVRGFAKDETETLAGSLKILKREWGEFQESIGKALTGSGDMAEGARTLSDVLKSLGAAVPYVALPFQGLWQVMESLATIAIELVSDVANGIKGMIGAAQAGLGDIGVTFKGILSKLGIDLGQGMAEQWQKNGTEKMKAANDEIVANFNADTERMKEIWLGGQAEITEKTQEHSDARRKITGAEGQALIALQQNGYEHLTDGQRLALSKLETELKTHHGTTVRLTKDQLTLIDEYEKKHQADSLKREQDADKAAEEIQKLAQESAIGLLGEHYKAYMELKAKFDDKIAKLDTDSVSSGRAMQTTALNNLLLDWAGFANKKGELTARVANNTTHWHLQEAASLSDLTAKYWKHYEAMTGVSKAELEERTRKELLLADILAMNAAITDGADFINKMARATQGLFGADFTKQVETATQAIGDLGDAATKLLTGHVGEGLVEGVGALVSLGKTIFGGDAVLAKELQKNSERLVELRNVTLQQINEPGRKLAGVQGALAGLDLKALSGKLDKVDPDLANKIITQTLGQKLLSSGLSVADLDEVAKTLGITIRDDKGRLRGALLQQLLDELKTIKPGFGDSYAGKRQQIQAGVDTGAIKDELGAAVTLINDPKSGIPALGKILQGVDLGSKSSREGAVKKLADLTQHLDELDKADFGGASQSELLDAIKWVIDLLNAAKGTNLPTTPDQPPVQTEDKTGGGSTTQPPPPDTGATAPETPPATTTPDTGTPPEPPPVVPPDIASVITSAWDEPTGLLKRIADGIDRLAPPTTDQAKANAANKLAADQAKGGPSVETTVNIYGPISIESDGSTPQAQARALGEYLDHYLADQERLVSRAKGNGGL